MISLFCYAYFLSVLSFWLFCHSSNTTLKRQKEGIEAAKRRGKYLGGLQIEYPDNWEEIYSQ